MVWARAWPRRAAARRRRHRRPIRSWACDSAGHSGNHGADITCRSRAGHRPDGNRGRRRDAAHAVGLSVGRERGQHHGKRHNRDVADAGGTSPLESMSTITLTVVDTYNAVVNNQVVQRHFTVMGTATTFRVHDSSRGTPNVVAQVSARPVRQFSRSQRRAWWTLRQSVGRARGRDLELADIVENRQKVIVNSARIHSQSCDGLLSH